jgi:iron complex transport system permease protein
LFSYLFPFITKIKFRGQLGKTKEPAIRAEHEIVFRREVSKKLTLWKKILKLDENKKAGNMKKILVILFILSAFTVPLFLGEHALTFKAIQTGLPPMDDYILWSLRVPRMLFAFVVGAGLALVGAVFQALLRNDLATPYTLGVSSGGALGAVLAIKLGLDFAFLGFSTISVFSMIGSLFTLGLIWFISARSRGFADFTLILSGVTISLTISALILFIHYLADFTETYRMIRWLMGSLEVSGWQSPLFLLGLLTAAFVYFYYHSEAFNI